MGRISNNSPYFYFKKKDMIKKLISGKFIQETPDLAILVLRVSIGLLMLTHGIPKLNMLLSGEIQFPGLFGMPPALSLFLAVFAELFCSILLIFGLATRLATIPLFFTMAVAAFVVHANDPFSQKELALLYLLSYVVIFIHGSGKYAIDKILSK